MRTPMGGVRISVGGKLCGFGAMAVECFDVW